MTAKKIAPSDHVQYQHNSNQTMSNQQGKLSDEHMAIVGATAPAVAANIETIVGDFYPRMFRNVPAVCPMFNEESQRNKVQHRALAQSALAYVGHLANHDDVEPMLQRIAERHCAVGVLPEQYSVVHDNFLAATAHVLGDAVTAPVAAAWSKVLMHFATALIEREKALYEATAWKGCRAFRIAQIVEHGSVAKSFAFAPVDGNLDSVKWTAGQYVTLVSKHSAPRHYTISSNSQFRITPKIHRQRDKAPAGRMTSALDDKKVGDIVMMHAPYGTFTLADARGVTESTPLAFVAGGIGITPVVAMALEARQANSTRPIALFHCASTMVRPLVEEVPSTFTVLGSRNIIGNIVPMLASHSEFGGQQLEQVHFFLCAPHAMMQAVVANLVENGIALDRIHYEAFESHTS